MGDIYRHDINLKDKQSITMFSKRSTPYNKAELARLLYMQGYKSQATGLRVNTSPIPSILYDNTGENTNGAMTQKATTDAILALAGGIPDISMTAVTGNIWTGYKLVFGNKCIIFGKRTSTGTGNPTFNFGVTFKAKPIVLHSYSEASGKYADGVGIGDIASYTLTTTSVLIPQRYSNRGYITFIAIGEI